MSTREVRGSAQSKLDQRDAITTHPVSSQVKSLQEGDALFKQIKQSLQHKQHRARSHLRDSNSNSNLRGSQAQTQGKTQQQHFFSKRVSQSILDAQGSFSKRNLQNQPKGHQVAASKIETQRAPPKASAQNFSINTARHKQEEQAKTARDQNNGVQTARIAGETLHQESEALFSSGVPSTLQHGASIQASQRLGRGKKDLVVAKKNAGLITVPPQQFAVGPFEKSSVAESSSVLKTVSDKHQKQNIAKGSKIVSRAQDSVLRASAQKSLQKKDSIDVNKNVGKAQPESPKVLPQVSQLLKARFPNAALQAVSKLHSPKRVSVAGKITNTNRCQRESPLEAQRALCPQTAFGRAPGAADSHPAAIKAAATNVHQTSLALQGQPEQRRYHSNLKGSEKGISQNPKQAMLSIDGCNIRPQPSINSVQQSPTQLRDRRADCRREILNSSKQENSKSNQTMKIRENQEAGHQRDSLPGNEQTAGLSSLIVASQAIKNLRLSAQIQRSASRKQRRICQVKDHSNLEITKSNRQSSLQGVNSLDSSDIPLLMYKNGTAEQDGRQSTEVEVSNSRFQSRDAKHVDGGIWVGRKSGSNCKTDAIQSPPKDQKPTVDSEAFSGKNLSRAVETATAQALDVPELSQRLSLAPPKSMSIANTLGFQSACRQSLVVQASAVRAIPEHKGYASQPSAYENPHPIVPSSISRFVRQIATKNKRSSLSSDFMAEESHVCRGSQQRVLSYDSGTLSKERDKTFNDSLKATKLPQIPEATKRQQQTTNNSSVLQLDPNKSVAHVGSHHKRNVKTFLEDYLGHKEVPRSDYNLAQSLNSAFRPQNAATKHMISNSVCRERSRSPLYDVKRFVSNSKGTGRTGKEKEACVRQTAAQKQNQQQQHQVSINGVGYQSLDQRNRTVGIKGEGQSHSSQNQLSTDLQKVIMNSPPEKALEIDSRLKKQRRKLGKVPTHGLQSSSLGEPCVVGQKLQQSASMSLTQLQERQPPPRSRRDESMVEAAQVSKRHAFGSLQLEGQNKKYKHTYPTHDGAKNLPTSQDCVNSVTDVPKNPKMRIDGVGAEFEASVIESPKFMTNVKQQQKTRQRTSKVPQDQDSVQSFKYSDKNEDNFRLGEFPEKSQFSQCKVSSPHRRSRQASKSIKKSQHDTGRSSQNRSPLTKRPLRSVQAPTTQPTPHRLHSNSVQNLNCLTVVPQETEDFYKNSFATGVESARIMSPVKVSLTFNSSASKLAQDQDVISFPQDACELLKPIQGANMPVKKKQKQARVRNLSKLSSSSTEQLAQRKPNTQIGSGSPYTDIVGTSFQQHKKNYFATKDDARVVASGRKGLANQNGPQVIICSDEKSGAGASAHDHSLFEQQQQQRLKNSMTELKQKVYEKNKQNHQRQSSVRKSRDTTTPYAPKPNPRVVAKKVNCPSDRSGSVVSSIEPEEHLDSRVVTIESQQAAAKHTVRQNKIREAKNKLGNPEEQQNDAQELQEREIEEYDGGLLQLSFGRAEEHCVATDVLESPPLQKIMPDMAQMETTARKKSMASKHRYNYDSLAIGANQNGSPVFNSRTASFAVLQSRDDFASGEGLIIDEKPRITKREKNAVQPKHAATGHVRYFSEVQTCQGSLELLAKAKPETQYVDAHFTAKPFSTVTDQTQSLHSRSVTGNCVSNQIEQAEEAESVALSQELNVYQSSASQDLMLLPDFKLGPLPFSEQRPAVYSLVLHSAFSLAEIVRGPSLEAFDF